MCAEYTCNQLVCSIVKHSNNGCNNVTTSEVLQLQVEVSLTQIINLQTSTNSHSGK